MTSVGENQEKSNTIQPPLLVFFSPSIAIVEAVVPEVGIAWYVGAPVEAADDDEDEVCVDCVVYTGRITISISPVGITCVSCCEFGGLVAVSDVQAAFVASVP